MKTNVSSFEKNYKAYAVTTGPGGAKSAAKNPGAFVLTTPEAQILFGDASARSVVNRDGVNGKPTLLESDVHMITLSLTFNEVVRMAAALAKDNGGIKLCDVPDGAADRLSQAFADIAAERGLTPLNKFFVTSRALLKANDPDQLPDAEAGMSDGCMDKPHTTVGCFDDAGKILKQMQVMLLFNECDFPGLASGNVYHVSGLYAGAPKKAQLPVAEQNSAPLPMVMQELHRTMK